GNGRRGGDRHLVRTAPFGAAYRCTDVLHAERRPGGRFRRCVRHSGRHTEMDRVRRAFTFGTPEGWYVWDPGDPVGASAKALDARVKERPALASVRQTILRLLIDFWDDAAAQQAVAAAARVEPAADAALVAS